MEPPPPPHDTPLRLGYARPIAPRHSPRVRITALFAGIIGVPLGALGAVTLIFAVSSLFGVWQHSLRADLPGDLYEIAVMLAIGLVAVIASVRWCRFAMKFADW